MELNSLLSKFFCYIIWFGSLLNRVLGVLTCSRALRVYVLTCLACLLAYVLAYLGCLRVYVLTCLRACVFTCVLVMIKYFIFLPVCVLGVFGVLNQPQKCILHYKENRSAKCYGRSCDVVLTKGSLCLKVTGALTILLGKKEAVEQIFYFCGKKIAYCRSQSGVTCGTQRLLKHVKPL